MKIGDGFRIGKSHFASMDMARAATTAPENYNLGEPIEEESSSKKKSSVKTPTPKASSNTQAMKDAQAAGISSAKIPTPKPESNAQAMKDAQAAGTATSSSSSVKSSQQSKGGQAGPNSWSLEKQGKKAGGGARNLMAKE